MISTNELKTSESSWLG